MKLKQDLSVKQLKKMAMELCFMYGAYQDIVDCYEDLDDLCQGMKPLDIANAVHWGSYRAVADLHRFDAYGNLESLDYDDLEKEILVNERCIREDYLRMISETSYDDFDLREEVLEEEECTEC